MQITKYKFKKEFDTAFNHRDASKIAKVVDLKTNESGYAFRINSNVYKRLLEANLLDWFEPIMEEIIEPEAILRVGDKDTQVFINKDNVEFLVCGKSHYTNLEELNAIYDYCTKHDLKIAGSWKPEFNKITIGCTEITIEDLAFVISCAESQIPDYTF